MFDLSIPRPTASGAVDLTGAKIFLKDTAGQHRFVELVERFAKRAVVQFNGQSILYHVCIQSFFLVFLKCTVMTTVSKNTLESARKTPSIDKKKRLFSFVFCCGH